MKKALSVLLTLLGIICILGGIVAIFMPNMRTHAAVILAWGFILLVIVKVGLPENNGLFSRMHKHEQNSKSNNDEEKKENSDTTD